MLVLGWIMAFLAAVVAIGALPWFCQRLIQTLIYHWRNAPPGGSAFNPLQEFVQPQIRHVIEAHEQRLTEDADGAPPGTGKTSSELRGG